MGTTYGHPNCYTDMREEELEMQGVTPDRAKTRSEPTDPPHWVQAPASQLVGRCVMRYEDTRFTNAAWLKFVSPRKHMIVWHEGVTNPSTLGPDDGEWMSVPGALCGGLQEMKQFFEEEKIKAKGRKSSFSDCNSITKLAKDWTDPPPRNGEPHTPEAHNTSEME